MNQSTCQGPVRRREFLRMGLTGAATLTLPQLVQQRAAAGTSARNERTALILVWLPGGASHIETYDPKPNAPSAYRGPYNPTATKVPGMQLCELLPKHAGVADKFSLLRSVVHTGFCHQQGTQQLLTGHPVRELKQKPDHPDIFSIVHRLRSEPGRAIPNYVGIPRVNYGGSAYLGPSYEPFTVSGDPNQPNFNVPNVGLKDKSQLARLRERASLRDRFDRMKAEVDALGNIAAFDSFATQAWNMLTSPATEEAFDISKEPAGIRDRYGRNRWGQQCLLARRLVEAGVDLVTTQFSGPLCGRVGNWDDHAVNHNVFEAMKFRAPVFDQAVSALIDDIAQRGMQRRVLVVVTGEFGRTPKVNYVASSGAGNASAAQGVVQPGRDHWPRATSILFAGGGIEPGQIVGATDIRGEDPVDRRVGRQDFLATLYRHLGVNPARIAFNNHSGRPVPILTEGEPIAELCSGA